MGGGALIANRNRRPKRQTEDSRPHFYIQSTDRGTYAYLEEDDRKKREHTQERNGMRSRTSRVKRGEPKNIG
jgi:hypothetical protein